MTIYTAQLKSESPLSFGKRISPIEFPPFDKEQPGDYDRRLWRERAHYDVNGECYIPPMMLKNCTANTAKYLSIKIPGQRNATYTKNFDAGLLITQTIPLNVQKSDLKYEIVYVPSDGVRGGSKRVDRTFPIIHEWQGSVELIVLDEILKMEVVHHVLSQAGAFMGLGRFRPGKGGFYGRFSVLDFALTS